MTCVATGLLKVVVVPSWHRSFVYPGDKGFPQNHSPANFFKPDGRQHPLFKEAATFDITLRPGDCLYLPAYFWSQSQSPHGSATTIVTFHYEVSQQWVKLVFEGLENQYI